MRETKTTRLLALALILPLAACADTGEEGAEMETADTAAATAPTEPAGETIELQGVNDSGISGEIESESRGDSIMLNVQMEGATRTDYAAHVHSGPCSVMDAPVAAQVSLEWGAGGETGATGAPTEGEQPSGGTGEAATPSGQEQQTSVRVGVAKADLTDPRGEYSLRFHGEGGEVIACADLPSDVTGGSATGEEGARDR